MLKPKPSTCIGCPAYDYGLSYVPGRGNARDAPIAIIGQGPGEREAYSGTPFIGPSGYRLSDWLRKAGLRESDIYIDNVVRCWLPQRKQPAPIGNRPPTMAELRFCYSRYALGALRRLDAVAKSQGRKFVVGAAGIPAMTATLGRRGKASYAGSVFYLEELVEP